MKHSLIFTVAQTITTLVVVAVLAWFIEFEPPYLTYTNLPFPVETPVVLAGDAVKLAVVRCNSSSTRRTYVMTRTLINVANQERVIIPATEVSIDPGCTKESSAVNVIPSDTKSGRYWIDGAAEAKGTLTTRLVPWSSQPFDVVARPIPAPPRNAEQDAELRDSKAVNRSQELRSDIKEISRKIDAASGAATRK